MPESSAVFVVVFFYLLLTTHSHADDYTITGCSSDGYIDVREDTGTTITCDGIQGPGYNIYWALSGKTIGVCGDQGVFDYCSLMDPNNTDYNLTRPSASRSELRILGNFRSKARQNLTCSQKNNATQVSCVINIIYPGLPTRPFLTRDAATRRVSGSYRVVKMYSSRNNYNCIWVMENTTHHEIRSERVAPKLSKLNESGNEFVNGTCSFSWPLPTETGNYTINLTVFPGENDTSYTAGTFVVDYTITECSSEGYIDVREDTGTIVTCDGINEHENHNIYWAISGSRIGDCNANLQCTLTNSSTTDYNLTRPTEERSQLRIQGNYREKAGKTITCSHLMNQTAASCKINVIYKYTIPECSSDGYMDVREDTGTTITCDGIQGPSYNIYWALSGNRIGDCLSLDDKQVCSPTDNTDYKLTRPSASRSELRILGNYRSKAGNTIMCSQRSNATQVSCLINIVYPGRHTHPTLSTDGVTWTVSGSVRVEKIYSSRNQYSCIWTHENETQHEIKTERVAADLSIFRESDQEFYNGKCSFSWPLPTEEGNYTSYLTVVPGDGDKPYSAGTFLIEYPGDPEIHCDDGPVVEKSDVTCQCRPSSTKAGSPAPSLSWPGFSHSSQLRLTNIRREDNGTQYTCQLTWGPNANIIKTASYTLHLDTYAGCETSTEQAKSMAAIGGGVGAAVAVIVIIIIVALVIVYHRRQKTYERPKVSRKEDIHPYMDLTASVTASTSDVTRPEYNETNIAMGQTSIQGKNTYEHPSPRRNGDALYTDLTPSVTSSAPDDASRDDRGNSIEAGQDSTKEPEMNTYEQPSLSRSEDNDLYTDLTSCLTSSDHSGVTRASNDPACDYDDINIATEQGN